MEINLTQILFQLVNFGVVFGALTYFLYRPILNILEERSKKIADAQKAAQKAMQAEEALEETKKKALEKIKKEEASILKQAQDKARERRQEIIAQAKKEAQNELEKQKDNWEKEKQQLISQTKKEMVEAVIETSRKILTDTSDAKVSAKVVDKELDAILKSL